MLQGDESDHESNLPFWHPSFWWVGQGFHCNANENPSPHSRECRHPLPDWAWPCLTLCHVSAPKGKSKTCHSLPPSPSMLFGRLLLLALPLPVAGHPLTMLGGCMQGGVAMGLGCWWVLLMAPKKRKKKWRRKRPLLQRQPKLSIATVQERECKPPSSDMFCFAFL